MSTFKSALLTLALSLGTAAPVLAMAALPGHMVGRVIRVHDDGIVVKLSHNQVRTVGAVYGVSRELHHGPKVSLPTQTHQVGRVRVVALLDNGRVRAEVVDGSIWAGDTLTENR